MNTPYLDKTLKLIKSAKTDDDIKYILAVLGSDAQIDSHVGTECSEYASWIDFQTIKNPS